MAAVKTLIVEGRQLIREMLVEWLGADGAIDVVGAAASGDEAMDRLSTLPQVLLISADLPGLSAFDAIRRIQDAAPGVRVVLLGSRAHDRDLDQALRRGVVGYVTFEDAAEAIRDAVHRAAAGESAFSPQVEQRRATIGDGRARSGGGESRLASLSAREMEVLCFIAEGLSKKQIAQVMHISVKTVENHTAKLMSKLEIHDRVELARYAIREGLVEP